MKDWFIYDVSKFVLGKGKGKSKIWNLPLEVFLYETHIKAPKNCIGGLSRDWWGGPDSSNWRAVPRETEPEALRCVLKSWCLGGLLHWFVVNSRWLANAPACLWLVLVKLHFRGTAHKNTSARCKTSITELTKSEESDASYLFCLASMHNQAVVASAEPQEEGKGKGPFLWRLAFEKRSLIIPYYHAMIHDPCFFCEVTEEDSKVVKAHQKQLARTSHERLVYDVSKFVLGKGKGKSKNKEKNGLETQFLAVKTAPRSFWVYLDGINILSSWLISYTKVIRIGRIKVKPRWFAVDIHRVSKWADSVFFWFLWIKIDYISAKQVYLWGSILEKKWLDMLVGALGRVGRGFGSAGRARLCWGVGFGRAGRAGLGWACARWAGLVKVVVNVFWFHWFTCTVWGLCWYHT